MGNTESGFLEIVALKKAFGSGGHPAGGAPGDEFSCRKGEFCVLLGPSGSGKSTCSISSAASTARTPAISP